YRRGVRVTHLGPARNPGPHRVPTPIERDLTLKCFHELRPLGSGPDKAHVPGEDVPELRQFVETAPAEPAAYSCHPGVASRRPHRSVPLGVDGHRAELLEDEDKA